MGRVVMHREEAKREIIEQIGPAWQERVGDDMNFAITAMMPIRTGNMRILSTTTPFTDNEGRPSIRWSGFADYTKWVDQGTGLYGPFKQWITPSVDRLLENANAMLAFYSPPGSGQKVFARRVRGQPGQHFVERGLRAIFDRVTAYPFGEGGPER